VSAALDHLHAVLGRRRVRFTTEAELQDGLAQVLTLERIGFDRELVLGPKDRVDFLVGGTIALEVKIGGGLAAVTRQLHRYAQHDRVQELLLVSSRLSLANLPPTLNGKPLRVLALATGLS
jgi:hypothetical protein